jgi:hypothetical protein
MNIVTGLLKEGLSVPAAGTYSIETLKADG